MDRDQELSQWESDSDQDLSQREDAAVQETYYGEEVLTVQDMSRQGARRRELYQRRVSMRVREVSENTAGTDQELYQREEFIRVQELYQWEECGETYQEVHEREQCVRTQEVSQWDVDVRGQQELEWDEYERSQELSPQGDVAVPEDSQWDDVPVVFQREGESYQELSPWDEFGHSHISQWEDWTEQELSQARDDSDNELLQGLGVGAQELLQWEDGRGRKLSQGGEHVSSQELFQWRKDISSKMWDRPLHPVDEREPQTCALEGPSSPSPLGKEVEAEAVQALPSTSPALQLPMEAELAAAAPCGAAEEKEAPKPLAPEAEMAPEPPAPSEEVPSAGPQSPVPAPHRPPGCSLAQLDLVGRIGSDAVHEAGMEIQGSNQQPEEQRHLEETADAAMVGTPTAEREVSPVPAPHSPHSPPPAQLGAQGLSEREWTVTDSVLGQKDRQEVLARESDRDSSRDPEMSQGPDYTAQQLSQSVGLGYPELFQAEHDVCSATGENPVCPVNEEEAQTCPLEGSSSPSPVGTEVGAEAMQALPSTSPATQSPTEAEPGADAPSGAAEEEEEEEPPEPFDLDVEEASVASVISDELPSIGTWSTPSVPFNTPASSQASLYQAHIPTEEILRQALLEILSLRQKVEEDYAVQQWIAVESAATAEREESPVPASHTPHSPSPAQLGAEAVIEQKEFSATESVPAEKDSQEETTTWESDWESCSHPELSQEKDDSKLSKRPAAAEEEEAAPEPLALEEAAPASVVSDELPSIGTWSPPSVPFNTPASSQASLYQDHVPTEEILRQALLEILSLRQKVEEEYAIQQWMAVESAATAEREESPVPAPHSTASPSPAQLGAEALSEQEECSATESVPAEKDSEEETTTLESDWESCSDPELSQEKDDSDSELSKRPAAAEEEEAAPEPLAPEQASVASVISDELPSIGTRSTPSVPFNTPASSQASLYQAHVPTEEILRQALLEILSLRQKVEEEYAVQQWMAVESAATAEREESPVPAPHSTPSPSPAQLEAEGLSGAEQEEGTAAASALPLGERKEDSEEEMKWWQFLDDLGPFLVREDDSDSEVSQDSVTGQTVSIPSGEGIPVLTPREASSECLALETGSQGPVHSTQSTPSPSPAQLVAQALSEHQQEGPAATLLWAAQESGEGTWQQQNGPVAVLLWAAQESEEGTSDGEYTEWEDDIKQEQENWEDETNYSTWTKPLEPEEDEWDDVSVLELPPDEDKEQKWRVFAADGLPVPVPREAWVESQALEPSSPGQLCAWPVPLHGQEPMGHVSSALEEPVPEAGRESPEPSPHSHSGTSPAQLGAQAVPKERRSRFRRVLRALRRLFRCPCMAGRPEE